ncbi:UDP-N-acetylmuramoyl-tripeptide--D-alanyl-D-alanine ligase [Pararhodospirillum photometricum]|uniref:UDP-N-acetylmuramoyl-tripeptide--D-alanyl-D- alanine ligase n=1 Tax=Pararhodospirillum photometricum TaxID=1084 RepID=UPI002412906D|nr:Mur ligase family protein [Pararhodospirillum photometricum]
MTTVTAAHLEYFPTVEAIADAKAEILEGLEPGGVAVFNHDIRHFERLYRHARRLGVERVISFGQHIGAQARLLDCAVDKDGTVVLALVGDEALSYTLPVAGRHWALNSLGVLALGQSLGFDPTRAARALARLEVPAGRGRRHTVSRAEGSLTLLDESYNASPESMIAALLALSQTRPGPGGRRVAVLGDMLELGTQAPALHAGLARTVLDRGVDLVYTAGPLMAHLDAALPASVRGAHAPDAEALARIVSDAVRPGDVVMVKGSHGSKVGRVVAALLAPSRPETGAGAPLGH